MIIDRDVTPEDIRIMFEYCGRKRDGSNAPPQRWIRPWVVEPGTGNPNTGKGALMNAAQKFLQDKYPKDRCRVLRAALLPPTKAG